MAGMELASGSRLPRISWAVTLECLVQTWNKRSQQETAHGEYHKKSRDSIEMGVAEALRAMEQPTG